MSSSTRWPKPGENRVSLYQIGQTFVLPKDSAVPSGDSELIALLPAAKSGGLSSAIKRGTGFSCLSVSSVLKEFF